MLGMIKRKFVDRLKETVLSLYKSLVRPNLEYCWQMWAPHYNKHIKLIKVVQWRAMKTLQGIGHLRWNIWD